MSKGFTGRSSQAHGRSLRRRPAYLEDSLRRALHCYYGKGDLSKGQKSLNKRHPTAAAMSKAARLLADLSVVGWMPAFFQRFEVLPKSFTL